MSDQRDDKELYEEAKKRVEAKRGFFAHLTAYIVVNTGLILIWAFVAGRGYPWFVWVLGGWGIGLVFNFMGVFVFPAMNNRQAIEKEMEKLRRDRDRR